MNIIIYFYMKKIFYLLLLSVFINPQLAFPDNWNVGSGGKPSRNSQSLEYGPETATLLWQGGLSGVIAQQAVIDGEIVAMSRIFNINDVLHGTYIVAHDLQTGDTLWTADLPVDFPSTDWRNRVSSFNNGQVYATRSGNTNYSYMYALDAQTGTIIWKSADLMNESSSESTSFASNGDLIVGNFNSIIRIKSLDGTTVWETNRSCPTSNGQEVAVFGNKGYYWEPSPYGPKVSVIDIETGSYLYSSDALSAGLIQQLGLFIGPDGTIYAPRTMNNITTDFLFALKDNGSTFEIKWQTPLGYVPFSSFGIAPDGFIYSYSQNGEVIRIDPANGNVVNSSQVILVSGSPSPRVAIDANGYVFVTNGEFSTGAFYSFNPDLTLRWSENIQNVNIGGPAIGMNGTLIVCGIGTNVRAYQGSYSLFANFNANQTEICQNESVQFTDISSGNVLSWEWSFEAGNPSVSTEQNPIVTYDDSGNFDVSLVVFDGTDYDTIHKIEYITVNPLPDVTFDTLPDFCLSDPEYMLTEGSPEGGTYSGSGVENGWFNPLVAGVGTHTLTYEYTDPSGCTNVAEQNVFVDDCTGIGLFEEKVIRLFPNPATDQLFIAAGGNNQRTVDVKIFDPGGNLILDKRYATSGSYNTVCRIDVSSIRPGIYYCMVEIGGERKYIKKLVVL